MNSFVCESELLFQLNSESKKYLEQQMKYPMGNLKKKKFEKNCQQSRLNPLLYLLFLDRSWSCSLWTGPDKCPDNSMKSELLLQDYKDIFWTGTSRPLGSIQAGHMSG